MRLYFYTINRAIQVFFKVNFLGFDDAPVMCIFSFVPLVCENIIVIGILLVVIKGSISLNPETKFLHSLLPSGACFTEVSFFSLLHGSLSLLFA